MVSRRSRFAVTILAAVVVLVMGAASAFAQAEHGAQPTAQPAGQATAAPAHQAEGAAAPAHQTEGAAATAHQAEGGAAKHGEAEGGEGHSESIVATVARLFNFALLAATLVYFLRSPLATYLASRSTEVRAQLVKAAEMKTAASAELAEVDKKLQALPAELEALRKTGADEVVAEEARIRQAADAERTRLLDVTKREINTQVKIAERELMKRASDLAVKVAAERVKTTITDADQVRLVDRYLVQVGK